jgi:hypothetical protein
MLGFVFSYCFIASGVAGTWLTMGERAESGCFGAGKSFCAGVDFNLSRAAVVPSVSTILTLHTVSLISSSAQRQLERRL